MDRSPQNGDRHLPASKQNPGSASRDENSRRVDRTHPLREGFVVRHHSLSARAAESPGRRREGSETQFDRSPGRHPSRCRLSAVATNARRKRQFSEARGPPSQGIREEKVLRLIGRRSAGLALLGLALVVPASASAKQKAAAADPYKVLVVTSTQDAVSTAGIAAITSAVGADGVVTAPAPADVGAQFTPTNLDSYRAVVFLNTGLASPLNDAQRANFEAYLQEGRRLRRHRVGCRDRRELGVPDQPARHPLDGQDDVADRDRQGLRSRP